MTHVQNTHAPNTFSKDTSDFTCTSANAQPPIAKITLKRKNGQYYKIYKSKCHKNKHSKKSRTKEVSAPKEDTVLDCKINYRIAPIIIAQDIITLDSSDEDNLEDEGSKSDAKLPQVIEIVDLSDEENVETCPHRVNQNAPCPQSVFTKAPLTKITLVDISSDEESKNVSEVCVIGSFAKNIPVEMDEQFGLTDLQKTILIRDLTHLSELMYVIINSRRDYTARVLRSERLCYDLTNKERTIAEDNYNEIISVYGHKFTQLFSRMESKIIENLKQDSFFFYNYIAYRLFVGINKIDHHSKINSELVKKLMLLLLKQNIHKSLVFEVFKEESAQECLIEFQSAFMDWSFPEAFIPIED